MADERDLPAHLTFSQRYGYEPLPDPMRLEEISDDLRRDICNVFHREIRNLHILSLYPKKDDCEFSIGSQENIKSALGKYEKILEIYTSSSYAEFQLKVENEFIHGKFNRVLDFIEIMIQERAISKPFSFKIGELFEKHGAAYRLDSSRFPYRFIPCATREQGEEIQRAIETIRESDMDGAATHLREAAEHINLRQYADAITDCIHAVESVAGMIVPESKPTLGQALVSLERAGVLKHSALRQAFEKLYGYTSDEQGLRHALLDRDAADVGLDEAVFMYGACASFAAYLTQKHRQVSET